LSIQEENSEVHLMIIGKNNNKQIIKNASGVAHLISMHYEFSNARINKFNNYVTYKEKEYQINIKEPKTNIENEVVFRLIIKASERGECDNSELEKLVNIILQLLNSHFEKVYITRNDISRELCNKAYIYIYDAENSLREFIMNFMLTKIGSEWWAYNITDSNINKANERKDDSFSHFINEDIYNIDFKDLAEIIFKNPSQYKSKADILNALKKCESEEEFKKVRENAISNWDKYFSEYFDEDWSSKWSELANYRNRIAHNKLISYQKYNKIKELSKNVVENIEKAFQKVDTFNYSQNEICIIEGETVEVRGFRQEACVRQLRNVGIEMNDLNVAIKEVINTNKKFTSADIVRKVNNRYINNDEINRSIGLLLSSYSDRFNIQQTGQNISVEDDNGNKTTCKEYCSIDNN
jgi:hypothetical protein